MNKGELVSAVAERSGLSRSDAARAVDSTFAAITDALRREGEVKVVGFGSFLVADRSGGERRNPRTGGKVQVEASKAARFRASAVLRGALNQG